LVLKDLLHVLQASWSATDFAGMHTCDFRARWEAQRRPQTMQTWSNLASWGITFVHYEPVKLCMWLQVLTIFSQQSNVSHE
jgi:hypothetical protein